MKNIFVILILFTLFLIASPFTPRVKAETNNDFKEFSFRGIFLGIPLDKQFSPCESNEKYKICYEKVKEDFFEIKNLPDLGFGERTFVSIIDNKIERIAESIPTGFAYSMLDLFKKKYGNPDQFDTSIVENSFGAKFYKFIATWNIKDCILNLSNRNVTVTYGGLSVIKDKYRQYIETEEDNRTK